MVKLSLPILFTILIALSLPPVAGAKDSTSESAVKALKKEARNLRKKGQALAREKKFEDALAAYAKALDAYAAYPLVHNEIGVVHFQNGRYLDAAESFRKALNLYPGLSAAWANLAECDRKRGRFGESARNYKEFIARRPKVADGYYGLAVVLAADENKPGALWAMKRFVERGKRANARKLDEVRRRISLYEEQGISPKDVLGIADAIAAYADRKRLNRAKKSANIRAHSGDEHYASQRYVKALNAYMALLKKKKQNKDPALRYKIGVTFAALRDYRAAMNWWARALELAPRRDIIFEHMVLAAMRAAAHGQMDLGSLGPDAERMKRAVDALSSGQPALALTLLGDPGDTQATYVRGRAALAGGNLTLARACFESLHASHLQDVDIAVALAKTLFRLKEGDKAQAILAKLPELREATEQSVLLREVALVPQSLSTVLPAASESGSDTKQATPSSTNGVKDSTTHIPADRTKGAEQPDRNEGGTKNDEKTGPKTDPGRLKGPKKSVKAKSKTMPAKARKTRKAKRAVREKSSRARKAAPKKSTTLEDDDL